MESLSSENFDYEDVEYIIECDASYDGETSSAGWNILRNSSQKTVLEGSMTLNFNSTTKCEIEAIIIALDELRKTTSGEIGSIIVRTDYSGVIKKLKEGNSNDQIETLQDSLSKFNSWSVECVDRDRLSRAHDLAKYAIFEYS